MKTSRNKRFYAMLILWGLILAFVVVGTIRMPHFWMKADVHGDLLMRRNDYVAAMHAYVEPERIAMAQYRNGDFEAAAKTYARVPGAVGAYNRGNAMLMHGQYAAAITSYTLALKYRPGWKEAEDNRALALARKAVLDASAEGESDESTDEIKPDEIKFDRKGDDQRGKPTELMSQQMSEEQLRALWLRRVQTTPGDFLRAKFSYQAATAQQESTESK